MSDFLKLLQAEVSSFLLSPDHREYLIIRAEKFFDDAVALIDLPGPDPVIDPLLRAAIRPLVGRIYDELAKKAEVLVHAAEVLVRA